MSNEHSPYREEDTEARAQFDAEQRDELAEQARLRELSRHALAKEETPSRRFGMMISAAGGLVAGSILGGAVWWATDDWSVLLAAMIVGIIISVVVVGLWNKPEGKFPAVTDEHLEGAGRHNY